mmetsp:Transcript_70498/g.229235  ORF Transcript_70498/g.229235 Transcript_70498/m.229235 type:complete len:238 (-) Transcript_70498:173-886(-)
MRLRRPDRTGVCEQHLNGHDRDPDVPRGRILEKPCPNDCDHEEADREGYVRHGGMHALLDGEVVADVVHDIEPRHAQKHDDHIVDGCPCIDRDGLVGTVRHGEDDGEARDDDDESHPEGLVGMGFVCLHRLPVLFDCNGARALSLAARRGLCNSCSHHAELTARSCNRSAKDATCKAHGLHLAARVDKVISNSTSLVATAAPGVARGLDATHKLHGFFAATFSGERAPAIGAQGQEL